MNLKDEEFAFLNSLPQPAYVCNSAGKNGLIKLYAVPKKTKIFAVFSATDTSKFMKLSDNTSVAIGAKAPDFELNTEKGESWRLSDHLGKVVVLLFYPKNETLVCSRQLCSVRDNWSKYLETKALVVGISRGTVEGNDLFSKLHELPIQLLTDVGCKVTATYKRVHWIIPNMFTRAIIIVDAKGIIRSRKVMFSAFRPKDASVISSIYAARADSLYDKYESLLKR
jgi:thioredoxin-dependent peroxiredoxin